MLRVFICEDDTIQRKKLERIIQRYILIEELDMQLQLSTADPFEILTYLNEHPQTAGVFFLDVDLRSTINGIQLGSQIRNLCIDGKIILITTYHEMLPITFQYKVEAMDYILKDYPEAIEQRTKEALDQAYRHYHSERKHSEQRIRIDVGNQVRLFELSEIMFFETSPNSHKLILHLANGSLEFYGKLTLIEELSETFLRVHKSIVANLPQMVHVDRKQRLITFTNGETCVVSNRQIKYLERTFRIE